MSKSSKYWQKRFRQLEESQHNQGVSCYQDIEEQYRRAQKSIEGQLAVWYQRFADNNDMSLVEAKKMLTGRELSEFKWDVKQYIQYGKENAINGKWMKQLENASARYHISRLEALKVQTQQSLEVMFGNQLDTIDTAMRDAYTSGYYHTAYEIQKGVGVGWDLATLDDKTISKVINKPWAADGKNFSERVWSNREKLVTELNKTLTQNIILGQNPQKAIDQIALKMNTSKRNAGRLVMTEEAYFSSEAQKDCFSELDVEEFEIVATLDSRTCDVCQDMDGRHFPMSEWEIGVTAPPFHVNCRTTTVPYFDDNFDVGERAARREDGEVYYVPADMTYKEWKKSFVDGDKSEMEEVKKDPETELKELRQEFENITDGYSYDDFMTDFDSIEEGFEGASEEDTKRAKEISEKIKKLDEKVVEKTLDEGIIDTKETSQRTKRGQLDTGYPGKIPDDKLDEYNAKAYEQIKVDTGYSDEKATELHNALLEYFGGDYDEILTGEQNKAQIIKAGIERMPVYDGSVYRGLCFSEYSDGNITQFTSLKPGDKLRSKGVLSSWASDERVAEAFASVSTKSTESDSVILECLNNKTGAGVQHISKFGKAEAEVLSSAEYEVVEIITESKYDYVSKRKDLLYFPNDLTDLESELKKQVVCTIRVKEV